ncbi:hypothetical protein HPP92_024339 [Vanilla planifolia]|uniref:Uncharacterized protein n=1 Tax=Vanilla planifolia TaxID=51239 RepID=A0A835UEK9_VANPL|nr:hypothetical protein HPP92_024339 [Vanilla planifolia]
MERRKTGDHFLLLNDEVPATLWGAEDSQFCETMGKICCGEEEEAGPDFSKLLIAVIVILIVIMVCYQPRRRHVVTVRCY